MRLVPWKSSSKTIRSGLRTGDIAHDTNAVGTSDMGAAILSIYPKGPQMKAVDIRQSFLDFSPRKS